RRRTGRRQKSGAGRPSPRLPRVRAGLAQPAKFEKGAEAESALFHRVGGIAATGKGRIAFTGWKSTGAELLDLELADGDDLWRGSRVPCAFAGRHAVPPRGAATDHAGDCIEPRPLADGQPC